MIGRKIGSVRSRGNPFKERPDHHPDRHHDKDHHYGREIEPFHHAFTMAMRPLICKRRSARWRRTPQHAPHVAMVAVNDSHNSAS